jgi:hypothetical protein
VAPPPIEPPEAPATLAPQPTSDVVAAFPPSPGYGGPAEALRAQAGRRPDTAGVSRPATGRAILADAFTALLALEAGEPGAKPVRLTTASEEPVVTDALVDEVVRRVLQRLAPDAARDAVAQVVSDVAERLVREEIARIRGK